MSDSELESSSRQPEESNSGQEQRPVDARPDHRGNGYGYGGYDEPFTGDDVHLLDYVRTLYRRRWVALTAFLVVFLSVTVYSFTATPIYEATVKLLIEADEPNIVSFQEVIDETRTNQDYYQTQYDILRSRSLARATLERLGLWDHRRVRGRPRGRWFQFGKFVGKRVDLGRSAFGVGL